LNIIKHILTPTFLLFFVVTIYSQNRGSSEVGLIAGSASFTTDYGQRYDFRSNVGGNVGFGFGLVYYYNFTDYRYRWNHRTTYFSEHFRLRGEISYMAAKLEHFGKWLEDDDVGWLKEHTGQTHLLNFGVQLEFHWVDIVDFGSRRIPRLQWSPYLSAGVMGNYYDPTISSTRGDWDAPGVLLPKWDINVNPTAADDSPGFTLSATIGAGTRHKLGEYSDVLIESRWQYFFSNYVDGLNAKNDPANKYNDWLLWIHVGFVYYLN